MRFLFITDILDLDDPMKGYFHRWLEEFAKHTKDIHVIAHKEGFHALPPHVHVHSLGEERKSGRIFKAIRFYWFVLRYMRSHDVVFIFGNPLYAVYGSMWWKLFKKPVGMWYDAGSVTTQMKIATPFLAHVFTATTAGYQAGGNKKHIVGHGIDTHVFSPLNRPKHDGTFRISVVGNIRPAIDYSTMVRAIALIKDAVETTFTVMIAGAPAHGEEVFAEEMRTYVHSFGLSERIIFMGPVKNIDVVKLHRDSDLYLSLNTDKRIEKSLAEATLCALPVITSNRAFESYAGDYNSFVFYAKDNDVELAQRIRHLMMMSFEARRALGLSFREISVREHSVEHLVEEIHMAYKNG